MALPNPVSGTYSVRIISAGVWSSVLIAAKRLRAASSMSPEGDRMMIMEVMGRDAGWIALHTAIAGGAEICIIPEIPYDIGKIAKRINLRYKKGRGFVNIVIAEGARTKEGTVSTLVGEAGSEHVRLGGVAYQLSQQLKQSGCKAEIRETVLGHVQRGGSPIAFDRILASLLGVKACELALQKQFGKMVSYVNNSITAVTLEEATKEHRLVDKDSYMVQAARGLGISFGD